MPTVNDGAFGGLENHFSERVYRFESCSRRRKMKTEKQMIDKIKWDSRLKSDEFTIDYQDFSTLSSIRYNEINRIDDGFMVLLIEDEETYIPLHRIRRINQNGNVIWQRRL